MQFFYRQNSVPSYLIIHIFFDNTHNYVLAVKCQTKVVFICQIKIYLNILTVYLVSCFLKCLKEATVAHFSPGHTCGFLGGCSVPVPAVLSPLVCPLETQLHNILFIYCWQAITTFDLPHVQQRDRQMCPLCFSPLIYRPRWLKICTGLDTQAFF